MNYLGKKLYMDDKVLKDGIGELASSQLKAKQPKKDKALGKSELLDKLYQIALWDIEANWVEEGGKIYFGAGRTFGKAVFTRDISIAGLLALNELYPKEMEDSLKYTREARRNTLFKASKDYVIEGIHGPWDITEEETNIYHCGPITRRSDDIIWIVAMADLIEKKWSKAGEQEGSKEEDLQWLYDTGQWFFAHLYKYFYDKEDGLYKGQAVFVDVHFPHMKSNGYPLAWSISDCANVKATSTNATYKKAMDIMAMAAAALGDHEGEAYWSQRSNKLKNSILEQLTLQDGSLAYYKDSKGNVPKRRDALGTAFAVLFDVVEGTGAEQMMKSYPQGEWGIPLFDPFFERAKEDEGYTVIHDGIYHNETSWGFVDTLFLQAYEKATGISQREFNVALLARYCRPHSSFREVVNFNTTEPFGSESQLWTAAAFINACSR